MKALAWPAGGDAPQSADLSGAAVVYEPASGGDPAEVLDRCLEAGADSLVVISSARLYGASGHDMQLDETTELPASVEDPELAAVADADRAATARAEAAEPSSATRIVVLRPVHVLGDVPPSRLDRALAGGRLRTAFGFDPIIQVLHADDLGSAIVAAADSDLHGVFNVCGPGALPLSVLARETGTDRVGGIGGLVADLAGRVGIASTARLPQAELCYPINVGDRRFREASGWAPELTLPQTVAGAAAVRS